MPKSTEYMIKSLVEEKNQSWPLSPLDQIVPPLYIRFTLCIPTEADTAKAQETHVKSLRGGLRRTFSQIPFLGGVVVVGVGDGGSGLRLDSDDDDEKEKKEKEGKRERSSSSQGSGSGRFQIASGPGILFRHVDLTDDDGNRLSYNKLKTAHFPLSAFDGDLLAPLGPVPAMEKYSSGAGAPVMAAQANFIPGGLLLTVCLHHFAVDAAAVGTVLRTWAKNTRVSHGDEDGDVDERVDEDNDLESSRKEILDDRSSIPPESLDRTPLFGSTDEAAEVLNPLEKIKEFPQYQLFSAAFPSSVSKQDPKQAEEAEEPSSPPPPPTIPPIKSAILYFSASNLSALKALVNQDISSTPQKPSQSSPASSSSFISTNDVLSALLWKSITKARRLTPFNPPSPQNHPPNSPHPPSSPPLPPLPQPQLSCSKLLFSINCRNLLVPPLPQSYLGNVIIYGCASEPIARLLSLPPLSSLTSIALVVRAAITKINNKHIHGLISLINSLPEPADLQPAINCFLGPDLAMTSWRDMGIGGLEWGIGGGDARDAKKPPLGKVDRLRPLSSPFDGIILVLPTMIEDEEDDGKKGGLEVYVGLEAEAMRRLLRDGEEEGGSLLRRFAKVRDVT